MQRCSKAAKLGTQYLRPIDLGIFLRRAFSNTNCTRDVPERRSPKENKYEKHTPLVGPRWSAEEDSKLLDLTKQGYTAWRVAEQLHGRSIVAVRRRREFLAPGIDKHTISSKQRWTSKEDSLILQKRSEGLLFTDIIQYLPDRTLDALRQRWRLILRPDAFKQHTSFNENTAYTEKEISRLIDLRAHQRKGFREIATEMNRSITSIRKTWRDHARDAVPEEVLRTLRRTPSWTREQDEHLLKLSAMGLSQAQIAAQMPSYSIHSVRCRQDALQNRLKKRQRRASRTEIMAMRRELQPVLEGTKYFAEVREMFPQASVASLKGVLGRMRYGWYTTKVPSEQPDTDDRDVEISAESTEQGNSSG